MSNAAKDCSPTSAVTQSGLARLMKALGHTGKPLEKIRADQLVTEPIETAPLWCMNKVA